MTEESRFNSRRKQEIFLSPKTSREVLGFTQPQIQYVPMKLKRMEREADHLPITSIDAKNEWNYTFNYPPRQKYIFVVYTSSAFPLFTLSSRPSYRWKLSLFSLCHSTDNGTGPISYVFWKKKTLFVRPEPIRYSRQLCSLLFSENRLW